MRKVVWLGIGALALGLGLNVASADVITVAFTGQVGWAGSAAAVTIGQPITATYSYDTLTPASGAGTYVPVSPPANISLTVGGQTYQSQNDWTYQITIVPGSEATGLPGSMTGSFNYTATPPASSTSAPSLNLSFRDYSDQWPTSTALLTTAPPVMTYPSGGEINVILPNSAASFGVVLTSSTLAPALTISPASSSFISQQNFDAVLLLSAQYSVTSAQASVNGTNIGFAYPGNCQLAAANSALRTALICPNASTVLAGLSGSPITIDWLVTFADGSTAQQSVIWNLVH